MPQLLITGCAGFIGWKTTELALAAGYHVLGIDNLNDYYSPQLKAWRLQQLRSLGPAFRFIEMDLENRAAIDALFASERFDAVINLAARAGVRYSMENPYVYLQTNANGVLHLLEAMRRTGVKKFVLASTSSLYAGQSLPFLESRPVDTPISPYAASKKAAEVMAYTYHHLYGIDVSVLRYFTVYGPAGRPDMAPLKFCATIAEGRPFPLLGDGHQSRDFTYVDDIASGTLAALKPVGYEIFNIGGGNTPVTIRSMITDLENSLGRKAIIDQQPPNPSDMEHTQADITKAKARLGWEPKTAPAVGFAALAAWYLRERSWLAEWL